MGVLDDFFLDGRTAPKECLYCGRSDGELLVAVRDHYGPTHWYHDQCEKAAENPPEVVEALKRFERGEASNKDYNILVAHGYGYIDNSSEFDEMVFVFTGKGDGDPYADQIDY